MGEGSWEGRKRARTKEVVGLKKDILCRKGGPNKLSGLYRPVWFSLGYCRHPMTERLVNLGEMRDSDNLLSCFQELIVSLWEATARGHNQVGTFEDGKEKQGCHSLPFFNLLLGAEY